MAPLHPTKKLSKFCKQALWSLGMATGGALRPRSAMGSSFWVSNCHSRGWESGWKKWPPSGMPFTPLFGVGSSKMAISRLSLIGHDMEPRPRHRFKMQWPESGTRYGLPEFRKLCPTTLSFINSPKSWLMHYRGPPKCMKVHFRYENIRQGKYPIPWTRIQTSLSKN